MRLLVPRSGAALSMDQLVGNEASSVIPFGQAQSTLRAGVW